MRATEFITERKKKRSKKKSMRGYFFPGYSYYGLGSSDSNGDAGGGDGGGGESVNESPEVELAKRLPSLAKHDYNTIDDLMRKVAKKHKITARALSNLFKKKYRNTPDSWIKGKLDESLPGGASRNVRRTKSEILLYLIRKSDKNNDSDAGELFSMLYPLLKKAELHKEYSLTDLFKMEDVDKSLLYVLGPLFREDADDLVQSLRENAEQNLDIPAEVEKFVDWTAKKLNLQKVPTVELSMDTEDAQTNHHTGRHIMGDDSVWVYAKNRNLVDILRTVFHELVHIRQEELGMVKPGSSYPGSPIEAMADMLAGKYIKIYGEKNHHIFQ
jgi:hypothetical protein